MHPFLQITDQWAIPTYGVFYLTAFLSAIALAARLATRVGIPFWKMVDVAFQFSIAGEIGSRLFFVIVEREAFFGGQIPLRQFLLAGRVVLGGIVVGALFSVWLFRKHRLPVLAVFDASLAGVPLGMGLGRLGCLMSGCCYGKPTDSFLGITFLDPVAHRISGTPLGVPLFPTQVFQALDGFLLCALLVWVFSRRRWDGQVMALFFVLSGLSRIGWEFLRDDRRGFWLGLATSQWIGLGMALAGIAIWFWTRRRGRLERYTGPDAVTVEAAQSPRSFRSA